MLSSLMFCLSCLGASGGEIAFVSGTEQEDQCVCVVDSVSGEVRRVGPGRRDGAPAWSPDGAWLAFETHAEGGAHAIYICRADGGEGRLLTHQFAWNHTPRWSPDGKRLAYAADADMGMQQAVVVYDLETASETVWAGGKPGFMRPVWMSNIDLMKALQADTELAWEGVDTAVMLEEVEHGALLAIGLVGEPGALSTEIFLLTPTQAAPLFTLVDPDTARYAEWAVEPGPKGRAIAYESNDGGDREIFVLGSRGIADVSNDAAADWNPVWASDEKRLAFESFRGGRRGVYRLFVDTARVYTVDAGPGYDAWAPCWSPEGERIAYVSDKSGQPQIYVAGLDNKESHVLTSGPAFALAPAWRPEPKP